MGPFPRSKLVEKQAGWKKRNKKNCEKMKNEIYQPIQQWPSVNMSIRQIYRTLPFDIIDEVVKHNFPYE